MSDQTINFPISITEAELEGDARAVADASFCSLWPAGLAMLQGLQSASSNLKVKAAIAVLIFAGNYYCKPS